jgi:hypothetical protein
MFQAPPDPVVPYILGWARGSRRSGLRGREGAALPHCAAPRPQITGLTRAPDKRNHETDSYPHHCGCPETTRVIGASRYDARSIPDHPVCPSAADGEGRPDAGRCNTVPARAGTMRHRHDNQHAQHGEQSRKTGICPAAGRAGGPRQAITPHHGPRTRRKRALFPNAQMTRARHFPGIARDFNIRCENYCAAAQD